MREKPQKQNKLGSRLRPASYSAGLRFEPPAGIEPASVVYKTTALPLS